MRRESETDEIEWQFDALDLRENVTLVLHDWGSALGFHWASRHPERISAIAYMESIVWPREWEDLPPSRAPLFRDLRSAKGEEMILEQNFFIEVLLPKLVIRPLGEMEMNAYRRPFLDGRQIIDFGADVAAPA